MRQRDRTCSFVHVCRAGGMCMHMHGFPPDIQAANRTTKPATKMCCK